MVSDRHSQVFDRGAGSVGVVTRIPTDDARRLLGECYLFHELDADERNVLFGRVRVRNYAAGETIFLMGSPGDSMMAVLSGSVRISVPSPDGKDRTADARAMTACSLAILERREVLSFLDRYPHVWPKLVEVLCNRLRNTDQHIAELALLELPARLAKALLRLANAEEAPAGRATLQVQLSQRELGNICGATRESINKCLRAWQRRGIVQIEESLVTVANRTALEELAELAER